MEADAKEKLAGSATWWQAGWERAWILATSGDRWRRSWRGMQRAMDRRVRERVQSPNASGSATAGAALAGPSEWQMWACNVRMHTDEVGWWTPNAPAQATPNTEATP